MVSTSNSHREPVRGAVMLLEGKGKKEKEKKLGIPGVPAQSRS